MPRGYPNKKRTAAAATLAEMQAAKVAKAEDRTAPCAKCLAYYVTSPSERDPETQLCSMRHTYSECVAMLAAEQTRRERLPAFDAKFRNAFETIVSEKMNAFLARFQPARSFEFTFSTTAWLRLYIAMYGKGKPLAYARGTVQLYGDPQRWDGDVYRSAFTFEELPAAVDKHLMPALKELVDTSIFHLDEDLAEVADIIKKRFICEK